MKIREVKCKSILNKSGLSDYCLNCYVGCEHGCKYCYARFMKKYTNHAEPWGSFVDIKINAAEVLAKEVKKKQKGEVFISSVCDGWQPQEEKYKLSRQCLGILLKNGFSVSILTKNSLIVRDFDLLKENPEKVDLGVTLTTLDEDVRKLFEPYASIAQERIGVLEKASSLGIKSYVFLGPFLPYLSDKESDINRLFNSLSKINLAYIYADRLNSRSGVWESICPVLERYAPSLIAKYKMFLFDKESSRVYSKTLASRVRLQAKKYNLDKKLRLCF